jgi:predicted PolB exonuclease-like 3'-5' exonuclease
VTAICMKPSIIVWDLETVPDIGGFAAANDLVGKSDVEVREAIGDKFPKHIYHSIVCIGALVAHREPAFHQKARLSCHDEFKDSTAGALAWPTDVRDQ